MAESEFDIENFLPYRLNVLAERVSRSLAEIYERQFGIGIAEWRVLAHLSARGTLSVRQLRDLTNLDKSRLSRAAADLVSKDLVTKAFDGSDRRLVLLALTEKGRNLFDQIRPQALAFERQFLAPLPAGDTHDFLQNIERLLGQLSDERAGPSPSSSP